MYLIDSHCHLNLLKYEGALAAPATAIENAQQAQVGTLLTVATCLKDFSEVHALAQQFPRVFCSVGVHPHNEHSESFTCETLAALAQKTKVVALGETGLDYHYNNEAKAVQHENFRRHIQVACDLNKPLIIHTRDAKADTLTILREEKAEKAGGVLHCFTEDWAMAEAALALGFYISISGIVTFKNAKQVQEVAKKVPLDRLLVETDSPFLAPVPYRGKQNQPAYVREVAAFIAQLRDTSLEEVARQTTANFYRLFHEVPR